VSDFNQQKHFVKLPTKCTDKALLPTKMQGAIFWPISSFMKTSVEE